MNDLKKVLSVMLTAAMVSASCVTSYAATPAVGTDFTGVSDVTLADWSLGKYGSAASFDVTSEGYEGNGLVVTNKTHPSALYAYTNLKSALTEGEEYTLSYRYKGTGSRTDMFMNGDWAVRHFTDPSVRDGKWHFIEYKFTANANQTADTQFKILCRGNEPVNCVIDNLSLKGSDGAELIKNGDFENVAGALFTDGDNYRNMEWTEYYYFNNALTLNYDRQTHWVRGTDKYKHSGNYGLHLKHTNKRASNTKMQVFSPGKYTLTSGVTYRAELWAKVGILADNGSVRMYVNNDTMANADADIGRFTKQMVATEDVDSNGFVRYENVFTATANKTNNMIIYLDSGVDMVIDDFKLYQVDAASGTETLLVEETFEKVVPFRHYSEGNYETASWRTGYNLIDEALKGKFVYVEATDDVAYGNNGYSMKFQYPNISATNTYIFIDQKLDSPLTAGEYTLVFHTKGQIGTMKAGTWGDGFTDVKNAVKADAGDGWTKYTLKFNVDGTDDETVAFQATAGNYFYLDNVSLTDAGGTEYVINGNFENSAVTDYVSAMNLSAVPAGSETAIASWVNPNTSKLEKIGLYVNGAIYNEGINVSRGDANTVTLTGLENYKTNEIKVVAEVDGIVYEAIAEVITDDKGQSYAIGAWTADRTEAYSADFNIDTEVSAEGENSLRADINSSNSGAKVSQTVTLAAETPYVLTFKAKSEGITGFSAAVGDMVLMESDANGETHEWSEYSYVIDAAEAERTEDIKFFVESGCGALWIDDVKLQENHPLLGAVGDSIIADGGFEFEQYTISEPVFRNVTDMENITDVTEIEAGTIEVNATVRNITMDDSFAPVMIAALYDGTKLVNASFVEQTEISNTVNGAPVYELAVTVAVPELTGHDYNIKVMYWDGTDTMKSLGTADVLN